MSYSINGHYRQYKIYLIYKLNRIVSSIRYVQCTYNVLIFDIIHGKCSETFNRLNYFVSNIRT